MKSNHEATPPAPRADRVGNAVRRAWTHVLGAEGLRANEAFDVSGGDSLTFLRFVHLIEEELGEAIDLGAVSLAHTFNELVDALTQAPGSRIALVSDRPRVFFVPVAGGAGPGQAAFRAGCAGYLDIEIVDLPHWVDLVRPGYTFQNLTDFIVDRIVAASPTGPILLAGYCFGGAIAATAAQDLVAMGREVRLFAMLDGDLEWFRRPTRQTDFPIFGLDQLKTARWSWQQGRLTEFLARIVSEATTRRTPRLLPWFSRSALYRRLPAGFAFYLNLHLLLKLLPSLDRAELNKRMRRADPLAVPMAVFRTHLHTDRPDDLGWSDLFRPVIHFVIKTEHERFFAPAVLEPLCGSFVTWVRATLNADTPEGARRSMLAAD